MAVRHRKRRLAFITVVYWFLLCYLIAALAWWFIELWQQNEEMYHFRLALLDRQDPAYESRLDAIRDQRQRNYTQYIGEGSIFLVLTLVGAVFVYRATRQQIRLNAQQQNFMMAVTHELKTPISILKLNLEMQRKHRLDEDKQRRIIDSNLQETNRLNDLCNNILLSSQLDAGGFRLNREETDLTALLRETVSDFQQRFRKRTIEWSAEEGIHAQTDPLLLRLALNNIIENALKYSTTEDPVRITLAATGSACEIRIYDQGEGIADAEKEKVFGRFYRIGTEQTRKTKGTGLGLYLTRKIIRDHGGSIHVEDNQPQGSTFVIILPKQSL